MTFEKQLIWTDTWAEFDKLVSHIHSGENSRENVSEALAFLGNKIKELMSK